MLKTAYKSELIAIKGRYVSFSKVLDKKLGQVSLSALHLDRMKKTFTSPQDVCELTNCN